MNDHPLTGEDGTMAIAPCPECGFADGYVDDDGKIRCENCDEVQA